MLTVSRTAETTLRAKNANCVSAASSETLLVEHQTIVVHPDDRLRPAPAIRVAPLARNALTAALACAK